MPIPTPAERVGREVAGRYRIERLLAQGGMGVLYQGRHLLTERQVAIKFLRPRDDPNSVDADRFLREARVAARLEHPNVVEILDMGVDEQSPYLVMELLKGQPLSAKLDRAPLSVEQAFAWLAPIMGALAVAHDAGIVHRDLKPDNIFLASHPSGHIVPKLLDFGVAKDVGEGTLTESGVTVGTPAYMSPEQARGEGSLGPASDVWSMGVVWYRALSQALPHTGGSSTGLLIKIVTEDAEPLLQRAPQLPRLLAASIDRALDRQLDVRYGDMRSFAEGLVRAATQQNIELPLSRDVVGLPDWDAWCEGRELSTRSLPAVPAVELEQAPAVQDSAARPTTAGQRAVKPSRPAWLLPAAIGALVAAAAYGLWPSPTIEQAPDTEETAANAPEPPPARDEAVPPQQPAPTVPALAPPPEREAVPPKGNVKAAKATEADEPKKKPSPRASRNKRRKRVKNGARAPKPPVDTEPKVTPAKPARGNPLDLRRDWPE